MGYTHYWRQPKWTKDDREGYTQALPMIRDILLVRHKPLLCQSFGLHRPPVINSREIQFNGLDGCEDFIFANGVRHSIYCKTGHLPYDLPVCETLLVLHAHCLNLVIESDGLGKRDGLLVPVEGAWSEALANIRKHYQRGLGPGAGKSKIFLNNRTVVIPNRFFCQKRHIHLSLQNH